MSIETVLSWLGFGDQALAAMGPTLTILLSWAGGGAVAQALKYPISQIVSADWFDWIVRTIAVAATFGFAVLLSDAVSLPLAAVAGLAQPVWYHASLSVIRKFWPWLEVNPIVGSLTPPNSAYRAAAQRQADRAGQDSGV
jgi:hypothetical protein